MFESISNIFSLPTISRNKYKHQPSLSNFLKTNRAPKYPQQTPFKDHHFDTLIQSLKNPIEEWILQQQPHLKTHAVNRAIFQLVIENSKSGNLSLQEQSKITVHNLFVLMVQYDVMGELIKDMGMRELQALVDGACGIILREPEDSIEELTCVIHHILTKKHFKKKQKDKNKLALLRSMDLDNLQYFAQIYGNLPSRLKQTFYDSVPRVIPMIAELLKLILATDDSGQKFLILKDMPWLHKISCQLLELICSNISQIVRKDVESSALDSITFIDDPNPELKKKLVSQAKKIFNQTGVVSSKQLFVHATRQLYYLQHIVRLQKFMVQLAHEEEGLREERQSQSIKFITFYLQASLKYDVNIPETNFSCLMEIVKLMHFDTKTKVQQLASVCSSESLSAFIMTIQESEAYQWKRRPKVREPSNLTFTIEKDQSLLYFILKSVFSLQTDHLQLINLILQRIHKNFRPHVQYYLVKNGLLHFLIEEEVAIQGSERKANQLYFSLVAALVKENTFIHCILDELLAEEFEKTHKTVFGDEIRKHFYEAKQFLMIALADTLSTNARHKEQQYFLPFSLQLLLYPESKGKPKHDIWISYIHDVIIRQLKKQNERLSIHQCRDKNIDKDINQWVTIAIMLQIEYVMFKRGQDFQLGQFTMNYMTNILNQAIKWKYEDETSVMRRILGNYQSWETYYTDAILSTENNDDVIEAQLGPNLNFLFLKRWNRKICNSINIFIESVLTTDVSDELF